MVDGRDNTWRSRAPGPHHGGGGGATPRVLGRQLPPPPPSGRQLVVKGMSPRSQYICIYKYIYLYVCMYVLCHGVTLIPWPPQEPTPEVPSVAGNTQADDTLPSIVGRGGANCRITPGPHTQLFGGARPPPPPPGTPGTALPGAPPRTPPSKPPPPPPRGLRPTVSWGGSWRPEPRGRPPPPPWASRIQKHSEAGYGWLVDRGAWTAKTVKRTRQQPAQPQYANHWAPLTRKRHTMPHPAQPWHTNHWAP